jgi:hypothetical protein
MNKSIKTKAMILILLKWKALVGFSVTCTYTYCLLFLAIGLVIQIHTLLKVHMVSDVVTEIKRWILPELFDPVGLDIKSLFTYKSALNKLGCLGLTTVSISIFFNLEYFYWFNC